MNSKQDSLRFPTFIGSQTFEQRKYEASAAALIDNNFQSKGAFRQVPEEVEGPINASEQYFVERKLLSNMDSTSNNGNMSMNLPRERAASGLFSAAVSSGDYYHQATQAAGAHVNAEIANGKASSRVSKASEKSFPSGTDVVGSMNKISLNPDDTYARVCSLGHTVNRIKTPDYGSLKMVPSPNDAEPISVDKNTTLIEDEGWNPLFYEPVLVLCRKGKVNSDGSTQVTLYQQLQNWLALGEANYLKKKKAFELAKQKAVENLKFKQQKQQKQQTKSQQQNDVNKPSSSNRTFSLAVQPPRKQNTWLNYYANSGIQSPVNNYQDPDIQATLGKNPSKTRSNYGFFKGPAPTLTSSAFSEPYLWSVDSSNPFWAKDQRPDFPKSDIDDAHGSDLLSIKPKKKESTELVDAIKAGVGLLDPSPLEAYYSNFYGDSADQSPYNSHNTSHIQGNEMPSCSVENFQSYREPMENGAWRENNTFFNHNSHIGKNYYQTYRPSTVDNYQMHITPYDMPLPESSETPLSNRDFEFPQTTQRNTADDSQYYWKTVRPPASSYWSNHGFEFEQNSQSYSGPKKTLKSNIKGSMPTHELPPMMYLKDLMKPESSDESDLVTSDFLERKQKQLMMSNRQTKSEECMSGSAENYVDIGQNSFKPCPQYPFGYSEIGWNGLKNSYNTNNNTNETQFGESSSNISLRCVTSAELEYEIINKTKSSQGNAEKRDSNKNMMPNTFPVNAPKGPFDKQPQFADSKGFQYMPHQCARSQVKSQGKEEKLFDLEAIRSKLKSFNLYMEPKELSSRELQRGFEYSVQAIKEIFKIRINNRLPKHHTMPTASMRSEAIFDNADAAIQNMHPMAPFEKPSYP